MTSFSGAPLTRRIVVASLSALLLGCSALPGQPGSITSTTILAPRPVAAAFTASGRIAARVTGEGSRGFSGGFSWSRRSGEDTIELLTPLGQIAARMNVTAAGASIDLADGRSISTTDPEQFLSDHLGVTLPLAALPSWLQGVPVKGSAYRAETDSLGRPTTLWQNGWQIQYTAYADDEVKANPTRLQLSQGDVEARMIISEWSPR